MSRLKSEPSPSRYYSLQISECWGGWRRPGSNGWFRPNSTTGHYSGRCSFCKAAGFTAWPHITDHDRHPHRWNCNQQIGDETVQMTILKDQKYIFYINIECLWGTALQSAALCSFRSLSAWSIGVLVCLSPALSDPLYNAATMEMMESQSKWLVMSQREPYIFLS